MYAKPVSTIDLRDNLAAYLKFVVDTKTPLVIKKYRTPIVLIKPFVADEVSTSCIDSFFGFLSRSDKETGEKFVTRLRRSSKEKNYLKKILSRP